MARWQDVPIENKVLTNVNETALRIFNAALENAYISEVGTLHDFPRLREIIDLPGNKPVFMESWDGDLIANTGGRTYRVDLPNIVANDVTGAVLNGAGRCIFAITEDQLMMSAGGPVIRLRGNKTQELGDNPPEATHVAFIDGYLVLNQPRSQQWRYAAPGQYEDIPDLNVYSAESRPDIVNAIIIDEFGELIVAGPLSIEQYDTVNSGDNPFQQRWDLSGGLLREAPYTLLAADNRIWGVNKQREFVAYTAQTDSTESKSIQRSLTGIDNWHLAWTTEMVIDGQSFIVLQIPYATNPYGTEGLCLLYDYRKKRWSTLYGWDDDQGLPVRWPGWSYQEHDGRYLVGGEGKIYELISDTAENTLKQRVLFRSAHLRGKGKNDIQVHRSRISVRRGDSAPGSPAPIISIRAKKNNKGWTRWARRTLGTAGKSDMVIEFTSMGGAKTWQFEVAVTDSAKVEITQFEILTDDMLQ